MSSSLISEQQVEKRKALKRVGRAARRASSAARDRDGAIRSALEVCSVREVAVSAGLSPARVHQIRHGR